MKKIKPYIINLPKIPDQRGNLSFLESLQHIPFAIQRVYWIYDVPGGECRGGHAFKQQVEFIICLSGSFDVFVKDRTGKNKRFSLNRSYYGLFVPNGFWREMNNFSTNSLALVLASTLYDPADYIRDYEEFLSYPFQLPPIQILEQKPFHHLPDMAQISQVGMCQLIELEKNHNLKGNITVIENNRSIPFAIERVYYLYDVPGGETRGGHAHRSLYQLVVAASGSFDVILDDGKDHRVVTLNRPYQGLIVIPGIWRELVNFSSGSCCLVLASLRYDEKDYIRDYQEFLTFKQSLNTI
jgi:dTDP-4-dehydrorhamnose 3,5-epimerase-like enzyme